jgi:hypothetical protein
MRDETSVHLILFRNGAIVAKIRTTVQKNEMVLVPVTVPDTMFHPICLIFWIRLIENLKICGWLWDHHAVVSPHVNYKSPYRFQCSVTFALCH